MVAGHGSRLSSSFPAQQCPLMLTDVVSCDLHSRETHAGKCMTQLQWPSEIHFFTVLIAAFSLHDSCKHEIKSCSIALSTAEATSK